MNSYGYYLNYIRNLDEEDRIAKLREEQDRKEKIEAEEEKQRRIAELEKGIDFEWEKKIGRDGTTRQIKRTEVTEFNGTCSESGHDNSEEKNSRRDNQIGLIIEAAKKLGYVDLMNIPEGGKAAIEAECLKNKQLFTESGFKHAWKAGNKRKVISMKNKEKYL